jgi:SulP family sulfate permease
MLSALLFIENAIVEKGRIIVIPQAVAFAMIAGLPPIYGFYTAMITPIIAALFGSSYHLISGPTTAISIVVYSTLVKFVNPETDLEGFISLALVLTFLAGLFQFCITFSYYWFYCWSRNFNCL